MLFRSARLVRHLVLQYASVGQDGPGGGRVVPVAGNQDPLLPGLPAFDQGQAQGLLGIALPALRGADTVVKTRYSLSSIEKPPLSVPILFSCLCIVHI